MRSILGPGGIPTFVNKLENKVYESKAGHKIELDNTSGAEKIKITHGKTNSHIEFTSTGKIRII